MNKTGPATSDTVHTYLQPNCLMMVASDRSALYHDRRTQGHASPKAMLYSCCHCGHVVSFTTALLKVRCNVGWKPKGRHKIRDLHTGVVPKLAQDSRSHFHKFSEDGDDVRRKWMIMPPVTMEGRAWRDDSFHHHWRT